MQNSTPFKILTLALFISLMASFVAFRSGCFSTEKSKTNKEINTSDSSDVENNKMKVDSPPKKERMMPGSKMMILPELENKEEKPKLDKVIIPSSKSGRVFSDDELEIKPVENLINDTLKVDSTGNVNNGSGTAKKNMKDRPVKPKIYSSKSAYIIDPQDNQDPANDDQ